VLLQQALLQLVLLQQALLQLVLLQLVLLQLVLLQLVLLHLSPKELRLEIVAHQLANKRANLQRASREF
jgi:hypothetical protein